MNTVQRWVIVAGLGIILTGLSLGLIYNFLVGHETLLALKDSYQEAFVAAAEGNGQVSGIELEKSQKRVFQYVRAIDVHTHLIKMASLAVLVAIISPCSGWGPKTNSRLTVSLLTSAGLFPLGVFAEIFSKSILSQGIAAGGALLGIGAFTLFVLGMLRAKSNRPVLSGAARGGSAQPDDGSLAL